ncbi:unnamed protein product [Cuscuta campestris]|uniref:RNase H type-1 domain-containing protein n=1 Tax=Cuscuta campestris TaxID=132261 RepID=A0A484KYS4_9ASTE|nr:unnamed protein product [Cuscuta campestris]
MTQDNGKGWWSMLCWDCVGHPEAFRIYYAIHFGFQVSNNEAEYEALINGLRVARELGATKIQIFSDSNVVVGQINGEFVAKEGRMKKYKDHALEMMSGIEYQLQYTPRESNTKADVLSKLSDESPEYISKLVTMEEIENPSLTKEVVAWVATNVTE